MLLQPALAMAQQFLDLVGIDPIMLLIIEHRNQYIDMCQQPAHVRDSFYRHVPIKSVTEGLGGQSVAEWPKQCLGEINTAAAPQRRQSRLQRHCQVHQVRPVLRFGRLAPMQKRAAAPHLETKRPHRADRSHTGREGPHHLWHRVGRARARPDRCPTRAPRYNAPGSPRDRAHGPCRTAAKIVGAFPDACAAESPDRSRVDVWWSR